MFYICYLISFSEAVLHTCTCMHMRGHWGAWHYHSLSTPSMHAQGLIHWSLCKLHHWLHIQFLLSWNIHLNICLIKPQPWSLLPNGDDWILGSAMIYAFRSPPPSLLFFPCLFYLNRSPYLTVVLLFIPAALGQQLPLGRPLSFRLCVGTCSCLFCGRHGYCSPGHGTLHTTHHHLQDP